MASKEKIVLIGAGSLQFGLGAAGCVLNSEILKGSTISLHDINEESLKLVHQACEAAIEERDLDYGLEVTTDRSKALDGATFIINSIEVAPRFDLWAQDYQIPRKHGVNQVTGENGGPGGLFHGLRVIPPILEICKDVMKICPEAYFLNFSNPMSRICMAIHRKFPDLKLVGLCHEYYHHVSIIAKIVGEDPDHLDIKAGGLNHFGVVLEIHDKGTGKDLYPKIRKDGPAYLKDLETLDGNDLMRFILEEYGWIPYTTDSHYGEYIHWAEEIADMGGIQRFKDTYAQSIEFQSKKITKLIKRGKGARLVKPDEEKAIPIIEGILSDSNYVEESVNLPNNGIISNLPDFSIVECPARINADGIHGIELGEYPRGLASLLRNQVSVQDLAAEAAIKQSKDLTLKALLADPLVQGVSQAENILTEMLEVQADYLDLK